MNVPFDTFIREAWGRHEADTAGVAGELAVACDSVAPAAMVGPFAALLAHVYGVHLAQWSEGSALLRSLRRAPGYDGTPATESPIARAIAALEVAGGNAGAADGLSAEDRAAALAQASSALLDRQDIDRAIALFDDAVAEARPVPLADASPAVRALAVAGNNLAATLEELPARTAAHGEAMVRAAETALANWSRCGGWLERQRAEYRLARSLLRAGRPQAALEHAKSCVEACVAHDATPFERFFAHAVAFAAHQACGHDGDAATARALALGAHAGIPEGERRWCETDLATLTAPAGDRA